VRVTASSAPKHNMSV